MCRLEHKQLVLALLVDLPAWISSRQAILDFIAGMPAFHAEGLTASQLARVQQTEPLLLLLNGWNEVTQSNSLEASTALAGLERDFPSAGILVASRTHHVAPADERSTTHAEDCEYRYNHHRPHRLIPCCGISSVPINPIGARRLT